MATRAREGGVVGAGGGGFPAHARWARADDVRSLPVNHQESEPSCAVDRWIGREQASELTGPFDRLLAVDREVAAGNTYQNGRIDV